MSPQELEQFLEKAKSIGGLKFVAKVKKVFEQHDSFPIYEQELLKIRGVGKRFMQEFRMIGILPEAIEFPPLSPRTLTRLARANIKTKEEAKTAVKAGWLRPFGKAPGFPWALVGYGWKSHEEVCAWVGLPLPKRPVCLICPCCKQRIPHTQGMQIPAIS